MALSTGIVKLLLGLGNLAFFLANFILSIVFCYSYIQLGIDFSGIVIVVQLTLVALTFVFGFGLWITCKRKFILLKLYTVVLFAFVVLQMIALVAVSIGAGNSEEVGTQIITQVCTAERKALHDAKAGCKENCKDKVQKAIDKADEASWFCCCADSCDERTWTAKMWELGLNNTALQAAGPSDPTMTALVQYQWPLLNCPEHFAHASHETSGASGQHASRHFDEKQTHSCNPDEPGGDPKPCVLNPARINDEGITGFLGKAMCDDEENCCGDDGDCKENGITQPDQVHWCGDDNDEVASPLFTCGGPNHNTKGPPDADATAGVSSGSTCKTKMQCVRTFLADKIRWFAVIMTLFLFLETCVCLTTAILCCTRELARLMVAGTFTLARKATSGDGVWYHDSGELTDDMSAADALGDYEKAFK